MRRITLSLIASAILLQASPAGADCMASRAFIVPVPGTALPPDPVIYAFVPEHMADPGARIESDDAAASVSIKRVSGNDTFNAFRLDVKKKKPGAFTVVVSMKVGKSENEYARSSFTIDPAWKPPADKVVEIDELTKESVAWECSLNLTYNLHPSVQAMAYRLEWSKTQEDFAAGKRESAVYPYSLAPFFDKEPKPAPAVIKLGQANCLSDTFRWPSPFVYAGLVALHPDGSETPAEAAPAEVPWQFESAIFGAMTDEFREEVHGMTGEAPPPAAKPATEPEKPGGCSQGGGGIAGLLLLVVSGALLLLPRRRQGIGGP